MSETAPSPAAPRDMSPDPSQETSPSAAPPWTPAPAGPPRRPFHTRALRVWWVIGVGLACLVVGAGAGSLVTHLLDHDGDRPGHLQRFHRGFGGGFPNGTTQGGPGQRGFQNWPGGFGPGFPGQGGQFGQGGQLGQGGAPNGPGQQAPQQVPGQQAPQQVPGQQG